MVSHSHSHLHRRGGAMHKLADTVMDVVERSELNERDHHHDDDNGNGDNGGNNLPGGAATLVSVVFVTASPTFSGPVAGFTTIAVGPTPAAAPSNSPSHQVVPPESSTAPLPASSSPQPQPQPQSPTSAAAAASTAPVSSASPSSASLIQTIKTTATESISPVASTPTSDAVSTPTGNNSGDAAAASNTPATGTVITNDSSSSGLSGGAKAGIAIGVILAVLALAAGAFALYRMRKRKMEEAYDAGMQNEKNPFNDAAAAPAPAPAPTRSVPQMQSQAPVLPPVGAMAASATPVRDVEKRAGSPTNPFGPGAETVRDVSSSAGPTKAPSIGENEKVAAGLGAGAAAAAVGAGAMATATTAKRTSVPAPLKINRSQSPALALPAQASPAASNFSDASMSSSAVAAASATGQNLKVHRVQMDFNPTMDDELKIGAGEIVEILHEYDDGWCLCKIVRRSNEGGSRVDRGVVPRTCLSRLPLKPRNNGQKRQGTPANRPESPAQAPATVPAPKTAPRAQSPALNSNTNKRSVSPGPYGGGPETKPQSPVARSRSNSMGDMKQARKEAPGPSSLNNATTADNSKDITLPIQIPGAALNSPVPASPVTRKPVPSKQE